ncbi:unnamed protein product [Meloidogyne enterolobii]|uniref:Uncharacterized protein n=1 Tax=Meloidogyne enterolobii TaxID=390850 RepID=A0ACB0YUV7_MELEN
MTVCFYPFHKVYAEKSFCRCGGSRACRAERRPPLRYVRRNRSEAAPPYGFSIFRDL